MSQIPTFDLTKFVDDSPGRVRLLDGKTYDYANMSRWGIAARRGFNLKFDKMSKLSEPSGDAEPTEDDEAEYDRLTANLLQQAVPDAPWETIKAIYPDWRHAVIADFLRLRSRQTRQSLRAAMVRDPEILAAMEAEEDKEEATALEISSLTSPQPTEDAPGLADG